MRRRWIIPLFLLIGPALKLEAQETVRFAVPIFPGNPNSKALLAASGIRTGQSVVFDSLQTVMMHAIEWYQRRGYWFAAVDSAVIHERKGGHPECGIWIHEGAPVLLRRVEVKDDDGIVSPPTALESRPAQPFDQDRAELDAERLLNHFENNGLPLAEIRIEPTVADSSGGSFTDLTFRINSGETVQFGSVRPEGLKLTKPGVVIRETRIKPGSVFRQSDVDAGRVNLIKTGLFDVESGRVIFSKGRADVFYTVKELQANTMDGVLGYLPSEDEGRPGTVTGRLEFQFRNLLGTGRLLDVYWEKKDKLSQSMRFGCEEPWLFGLPAFLGGRFKQDIRDSTFLERQWTVWLRYASSASLNWKIEAGQKNILPDSLGSLGSIPNARIQFVSAGVDLNTLDDPLNPRRGIHYETTVATGRRTVADSNSSISVRRIDFTAEGALPLIGPTVAYLKLSGSEYRNGDVVPASEQIRFGGARTLRGYQEDAFRGTLVAWANAEYRLLSGKSRVFAFCDFGAFQRLETTGWVRGTRWGYGFGLRIDTKAGLFGIDYGLGEGDGVMRGKIHVGLVNRF